MTRTGSARVLPIPPVAIDATGRAAQVARRKGASIAFRDRMLAELMEEATASGDGDAPDWLLYRGDGNS